MPSQLPIACSLTAAELPGRLAEMAAVGRSALVAVESKGAQAVLRFRERSDTRERLQALVAAEAECCAFLSMALEDKPGAIELRIEAPAGAEPVLHELVAAFSGTPEAA